MIDALANAIAAERAADKAVARYDAYIFQSAGRQFDSFKAEMLAADAAEACAAAVSRANDLAMATPKTARQIEMSRDADKKAALMTKKFEQAIEDLEKLSAQ